MLACAQPGAFHTHVAAELDVSPPTVAKWRRRFIEHGLAGLAGEPHRPPSILLDKVQEVVTLTLEQTPPGATHLQDLHRPAVREGR
ncbi:helix-turn-helix domain-containing protein [Actinomadura sp. B10D3]|uniref:helix-turn-helix domain-containing protein n=1 Tax=Actinomadura sp. B10D3 TaxID=3153557 RepID=UPI00325F1DF0